MGEYLELKHNISINQSINACHVSFNNPLNAV